MKKALIVWGGWDGHEPEQVAGVCAGLLRDAGFEVEISNRLDSLADPETLSQLDLIVPVWTMATIENAYVEAVSAAVASGVGIAGCHGGMCDAFRDSVLWEFITGGSWVAHPGGDGINYTVNIRNNSSALMDGVKDFAVTSEQYYLHVDPAVEVLATTRIPSFKWFHSSNGVVDMPVVWTKRWGHGRVFYNSLGHHADIFDIPEAREIQRRGLLWAADGKRIAVENGLSSAEFESDAKL
ncbi:MAG: ThuA domain-containing protein [Spirochaetales bacterium]|nr:ThuA domain-containing protein [Spirochaetales bacterium]